MKIKPLSSRLFKVGKHYATLSKAPGFNVYGERALKYKNKEIRIWNPSKSKLGAAIHKGMPLKYIDKIEKAKRILYLGIANGTTASHIEDLNPNALIYGVELSHRSIIDLMYIIHKRESNILPILESASNPEKYSFMMQKVDVLFVDIAQPHQTDIALKNANAFLKDSGVLMIAIKARSIDIKEKVSKIIEQEMKKITSQGYKILFSTRLDPYEKEHGFVIAQRK